MQRRYIFGPVPSRRLGLSLGVDLVPHKTCTLNCVYCECGATTCLTLNRREYVPTTAVIRELDQYLSGAPLLDYITMAGSGEPTLHVGFGEIAAFLKSHYPQYPLCLLTNGSLLFDSAVCRALSSFDLVVPSLDAATEEVFQLVNRPHPKLSLESHLAGLKNLRLVYPGFIRLEVFIVPGLNDTAAELAAIKKVAGVIRPQRIEIGTLDRPGTEPWVEAANHCRLVEIAGFLGGAKLIGGYEPKVNTDGRHGQDARRIIDVLRRRPCTIVDLQQALRSHPAEIRKQISRLLAQGKIEARPEQRGTFYRIKGERHERN